MANAKVVKAQFYVVFEVKKSDYGAQTLKAIRVTQRVPDGPEDLVVKMTLEVPTALLDPLEVSIALQDREQIVQAIQKTAAEVEKF